jgi:hypothetical protein
MTAFICRSLLLWVAMGLTAYGQVAQNWETPQTGTFGSGTPIPFSIGGLDYLGYWGNSGDYLILQVSPAGANWGNQPNICLVEYQSQTNVVFLASDGGYTWSQQSIGSPTPLSNSQCTVYLASATVTRDPVNTPQSLSVSFQISFSPTFSGSKDIWAGSYYGTPQSGYSPHSALWGEVTVAAITITVTSSTGPVYPSFTQQFTANVANTSDTRVTWSVNPSLGSISTAGLYMAPSNVSSEQAVTVTATSVADSTKSGSSNVTLLPTVSWFNTSWQYRKAIALDHTKVNTATGSTTPLANFPSLVSVTDPDLRATANGGKVATSKGYDIVFAAGDGITPLNYEVESYNSVTGQLVAWVNVPSLSSTMDTIIYQYFGNANAAPPVNSSGTWDQYFKGIWHLGTWW